MNLTALQTRCAFRYRDTLNRLVEADDWTEYLNDAYMDVIAADPFWPFLEGQTVGLTIAAGSGSTDLNADSWRVHNVYNDTDDIPLTPIPGTANHLHMFPDPANNLGVPQFYRLYYNSLEVYPYPAVTTTFSVDTVILPTALAAGSDEPVFPGQYHRILVHGALARAYEDDGNEKQAALHQARYERLLLAMKTDLLNARHETYPQVIDTW